MQVIKESAARIASSTELSPSRSSELEDSRAALVKELADVKKRFLAVAKKKQADFAKRVCLIGLHPHLHDELYGYLKGCISLHTLMNGSSHAESSGKTCLQVKDLEDALQAKDANIQSLEQQASAPNFSGTVSQCVGVSKCPVRHSQASWAYVHLDQVHKNASMLSHTPHNGPHLI